MKPQPFAYRRASSLADACAMLDAHAGNARILAGGQSLIPSLALRLSQPELLIDISQLADLRGIRVTASEMVIGALTRHADIERSADVRRLFPSLAEAARHIAHPAIRNRGTIGGSLALADPAAEWPAAALAFDMRFKAASSKGERTLAAADFFKGLYETALEPGEVLESIHLPLPGAGQRAAFGELTRRSGDYAIVGAFVNAGMTGGRLVAPRVAFFAVASKPLLAKGAMRALAVSYTHLCLQGNLPGRADGTQRISTGCLAKGWRQDHQG